MLSAIVISPKHKRTEGRARCGALCLHKKTLHYRGDSAETAAGLNVQLRGSVVLDKTISPAAYRGDRNLGGIKWRAVNLRMFVRDLIPRWEVDAGKPSFIWAF